MSPDIVGRLRPPRLNGAPASPALGEEYFSTATNVLYYWNGTTWITSGVTGGGTPVLGAAPVLDVGVANQIRAGRQLKASDFTALGLSAPAGLWNLSDLTDASGNGRALSNMGAVPFGPGINGLASTSAVFSGSTNQALWIADSGAGDPFRIRTGSVGCWFRSAKLATSQGLIGKLGAWAPATISWYLTFGNTVSFYTSDGAASSSIAGVSASADNRWHFAVATFDATTVRVYVDGVLEGSGSLPIPQLIAAPLTIGARSATGSPGSAGDSNYGRIDEAFVTADVLSDDQIRALYCASIPHTDSVTPTVFNLAVRRRRKGGTLTVSDFPTQPLRLHNFTAGSLNDEGSANVALTNNGAAVAVAGADGGQGNGFNFIGAQSLSSTDAGLPSGTAARSYGWWVKSTMTAAAGVGGWGTVGSADCRMSINWNGAASPGPIALQNGGDTIYGGTVNDGQWHLIIGVEDNAAGDGVKRKLYVDGRLIAGSTVLNTVTLAGAGHFTIGDNPGGTGGFIGQIDGAFVCGYALSQDQIATLYAKGSQAMAASVKNAGDHIEYADGSNIYGVFDTLDSQHTVDLAVSG
jgi:hypothetical protein